MCRHEANQALSGDKTVDAEISRAVDAKERRLCTRRAGLNHSLMRMVLRQTSPYASFPVKFVETTNISVSLGASIADGMGGCRWTLSILWMMPGEG